MHQPSYIPQREKYAPKVISSEFVGGDQTDPIVIKNILEGAVQLVFITPESILIEMVEMANLQWPYYMKAWEKNMQMPR